MATPEDHRKQAEHNQTFLETIDTSEFPDWVATVAFYKAVHLVEMLFRTRSLQGNSHMKQNRILKTKFKSVWKEFKTLYSFSRLSRYWCMAVKPEAVEFILQRLGRVERAVNKLMK